MDTEHFRPIGEVTADNRGRIPFGKAGVRGDDKYAVALSSDGEILLTPLVSIPKRELLVWEDQYVRTTLSKAFEQSADGEVVDRGSFAQHLDNEDIDA